jgi:hypothetical protein
LRRTLLYMSEVSIAWLVSDRMIRLDRGGSTPLPTLNVCKVF